MAQSIHWKRGCKKGVYPYFLGNFAQYLVYLLVHLISVCLGNIKNHLFNFLLFFPLLSSFPKIFIIACVFWKKFLAESEFFNLEWFFNSFLYLPFPDILRIIKRDKNVGLRFWKVSLQSSLPSNFITVGR